MAERPTPESDSLERLLRTYDRAPIDALATGAIEGALDDIGAAVVDLPRRRAHERRRASRLRRPRLVVLIAAMVATLGAGTAAATRLWIPTHTGKYSTKADAESIGPGEALTIAGTRFPQIALHESAGIPYPPGYDQWRHWVVRGLVRGPMALPCPRGAKGPCRPAVSTGQLRGTFAMSALCAWILDWHHAELTGDGKRAADDARTIAGALRWKAVRAEDPHLTLTRRDDAGHEEPTVFGRFLPYQAAVRAGNLREVERLMADDTFGEPFWQSDPGLHMRGGGAEYMRYLRGAGS